MHLVFFLAWLATSLAADYLRSLSNPLLSNNVELIGKYMGVSKSNGTPKSSILIWFSIINHPFWGTPIFENIHIYT